uniref:Uncharacterized protein n=1 Tax=Globodera pallida TaxID=36090 RepID=A0A183BMV8_GLOPA
MRPLISSSFEELRRRGSEIDGALVAYFRRMDIRKRSKFFFEVEREARKKWQEGEGEASFILYCRAMKVRELVLESMDEEILETQFEIREWEREFNGEEDASLPKMREICSRANLQLMAQDEPIAATSCTSTEEPSSVDATFAV